MKKRSILIISAIMAFFLLTAEDCEGPRQESSSGAVQNSVGFKIPLNANGLTGEQQNINDRIKVTTDPTKVLWIHLIALDGSIVNRMPVRCKVTSSGKRLEAKTTVGTNASTYYPESGIGNYDTDELMGPDGTFGDSDPYIYWFDPMGRYHQWGTAGGLGYLLTDYPIDLGNPMSELTGLYNLHEAAYKWQLTQEEALRQKEAVRKTEVDAQKAKDAALSPAAADQPR